jgi:putative membrane protein
MKKRAMKAAFAVLGAIGLALAAALFLRYGWDDILAAFAVAGWGMVWLILWRSVSLATSAEAWRILYTPSRRPGPLRATLYRWICEAVNSMLPVGQVGGDLVRAKLAATEGHGAESGAAVVVDMTLALLVEILFTIAALGTMLSLGIGGAAGPLAAVLAVSAAGASAFMAIQKRGLFALLAKAVALVARGGDWSRLLGGAQAIDSEVRSLWRRRRDLAAALVWHGLSTASRVGEVWLALHLLGHPVGWGEALIIEGLSATLRSAAFLVPGGLGVQEGSLLVLCAMVGIGPEAALALALMKRVREIIAGSLGLAVLALTKRHRGAKRD